MLKSFAYDDTVLASNQPTYIFLYIFSYIIIGVAIQLRAGPHSLERAMQAFYHGGVAQLYHTYIKSPLDYFK